MSPKPAPMVILPEKPARVPVPPNSTGTTPAADRVNTPVLPTSLRVNGTPTGDRPITPATSTRLAIDRYVQVLILCYLSLITLLASHGQRK